MARKFKFKHCLWTSKWGQFHLVKKSRQLPFSGKCTTLEVAFTSVVKFYQIQNVNASANLIYLFLFPFIQYTQCLKILQIVPFEYFNIGIYHHFLYDKKCLVTLFSKTRQMDHFGIFSWTFVNVARFARNVEWDFFCDLQTPWVREFQSNKESFIIKIARESRWGMGYVIMAEKLPWNLSSFAYLLFEVVSVSDLHST